MGHPQTKPKSSKMGKVSKQSTNRDRSKPQHCFITWTDWRAFQPEQDQAKQKQEDSRSASRSHIEGWHPEAFANRYRRASYPRLLPLSTKNLNILKSQRVNSWELDFLSSLLSSDMPPLNMEENRPKPYDNAKPSDFLHELDIPDGLNDYISSDGSPDSYNSTADDDLSQTLVSTPDFNFEKCLAEVEQIACDSLRDLPNMFESADKFEENIKIE